MRTNRICVLAVLSFIAACAGMDVNTDYDAAVDFLRYKTYFWSQTPKTTNPLMADRIVAEVDAQLRSKGWRRVTEGQGDAAVAAQVTSHEHERISPAGPGWSGPSWYGWGVAGGSTATVSYYTVGTLIVDIFDAKSKKAIWHSMAEGSGSESPPENQAKITEAVVQMFQKFPPVPNR